MFLQVEQGKYISEIYITYITINYEPLVQIDNEAIVLSYKNKETVK